MKVARITPALLRRWPLPALDGNKGKVARGRVVVVGGSVEIAGAVVLSALGALRAGAGTLQMATVRDAATHVAVAIPEARVVGLATDRRGELATRNRAAVVRLAGGCQALLLGPGMRDAALCRAVCSALADDDAPPTVVLDAGALEDVCTGYPRLVLTPHAGEAAKLLEIDREDVEDDPLGAARELASRYTAVVALKGACTYVVAPDGAAFDNVAGNIGLGTSGSGDTLSGVITGLVARGADPLQATVWGVHAHAAAGDRLARRIGPVGYLARELLAEVPALLASWSAGTRARRPASRRSRRATSAR